VFGLKKWGGRSDLLATSKDEERGGRDKTSRAGLDLVVPGEGVRGCLEKGLDGANAWGRILKGIRRTAEC